MLSDQKVYHKSLKFHPFHNLTTEKKKIYLQPYRGKRWDHSGYGLSHNIITRGVKQAFNNIFQRILLIVRDFYEHW